MSGLAPTLMVQGTASSVGKSLLVAAFCRFFRREGLRVAPFKSQNMALNSAVTADGLEIGRAQAVQAEAAGILPSVEMNPILLKPEGERCSQVVVLGKSVGSMSAVDYQHYKRELLPVVADSLRVLRNEYDLVIIEGAGSPAEINLKSHDLVNMHVAKLADAPVLLVGDIDRGGVFASFVGTLELLDPDERAQVAAFVVNKFRGDIALLRPGLTFLTERTAKPVAGVMPYLPHLQIADEDSLCLEHRMARRLPERDKLDIVVVRLPRLSNFDDVQPLEQESDVVVRFVEEPDAIHDADLVILPGSKTTMSDLCWIRDHGIATAIEARARQGKPVLGICGGYQMLGESIEDASSVESTRPSIAGLGLLPLRTHFRRTKTTAQVRARVETPSFLTDGVIMNQEITGYEIHHGVADMTGSTANLFHIQSRNGSAAATAEGAIGCGGAVVGTMLHGLFENGMIRSGTLAFLRRRKGLPEPSVLHNRLSYQTEFDRLDAAVRAHCDCALLWRLARVKPHDQVQPVPFQGGHGVDTRYGAL